MKNTFAIGIPDKVSAAERDGETTKIRCRCKCHQGGLKHVSACCKNGYIEVPKKRKK